MKICVDLSEYEKALTVLALRTYAENQLRAAAVLLQESNVVKSREASERGRMVTLIADLIASV